MADETELAVSLAMVSLLDLLSKSEHINLDRNLTRQTCDSISSLKRIMNEVRPAFHNHQPADDHRHDSLKDTARSAEKTARQLLVQLLRDKMLKSQLDRFFPGKGGVRARESMATQFRERVMLPFQQLEQLWPAAENGQQDNTGGRDQSGNPPVNTRVETKIVNRGRSVEVLMANLINTNPPPPVPPLDANIPPPPPADADANPPPPPADADANIPPPPADANIPPPPPADADANAPPPPADADGNIPPPPADPNAPPPPPADPNTPPPPVDANANIPPPPPVDANANIPPPPPADANANIPPPPADPNAPPPPPADPNAPPPRADANANIPPPPADPNTPLQVIAVVGRKNCGKTALVRTVFNKLEIKHHFDCRAWIRVSDAGAESWTESLLVEILLQMPVGDQLKDLKSKKKEKLIDMLFKFLMKKRYLIVLDNLGARPFNDFMEPFADSINGSRVIVTSTNEDMQNLVDRWMPGLNFCPDFTDEELQTLVGDSFTGGDPSDDLKTSVLRECGGSAAAISLLAGLLSAVEENRREALFTPLRELAPLDDFLLLSFNELPHQMKPCVLYMALFPTESEVPTRRLFRLWAAEGLLLADADADRSVQMRTADDCFRELERRNLIRVVSRKLDTSARSCRMPAFLHEFFRRKARAFGLLKTSPDAELNAQHQPNQAQNTATGHYDYLARCLGSVASFNNCKPGTQQAREIEVLLQSLVIDEPPDLLRVLDLEGVYKPLLPKKFENILPNLRYLGLRRTALDSIPESVGKLLLLETLDLKHTNITKVTSAIWNAKNLRHLYLSEASFDGSIPRHILLGSKLETLWGLFIETENSPMIRLLRRLSSLKKLGVTCRPGAASAVAKCISQLTGLKSLRLRSRDLFGQPAVLHLCNMTELADLSNLYLLGSLRSEYIPRSVLPLNLKRLTLSMLGCRQDPMPVLQTLSHLIDLRLLARSSSTTRLHCNGGFPELRVLKIWMLDELEEFVIYQGAMGKLEELDIRQCEKLGRVTGLDHINNLKSLRLTKVKEVLDPRGHDGSRIRVPLATLVKTAELQSEDRPLPWRRDIYEGGVPDETDEED